MSDVLVLCYHGVSPTWPADISVTPETLERQIRFLLRRGYRPATFTEAVIAPPHRKTLAITFDDAYRSVLDVAWPILDRLGAIGTVYVPTAFVDTGAPMSWDGIEQWIGGEHEHELVGMGWDGLAALRDAGWEIGSHTRTHPYLARVGDTELAEELTRSREECEDRLGVPCRSIAYPYGNVAPRVIAATQVAGYAAAGSVSSPRPDTRHDWGRVGVWGRDQGWRFFPKVSPLARAARVRVAKPTYPDGAA